MSMVSSRRPLGYTNIYRERDALAQDMHVLLNVLYKKASCDNISSFILYKASKSNSTMATMNLGSRYSKCFTVHSPLSEGS